MKRGGDPKGDISTHRCVLYLHVCVYAHTLMDRKPLEKFRQINAYMHAWSVLVFKRTCWTSASLLRRSWRGAGWGRRKGRQWCVGTRAGGGAIPGVGGAASILGWSSFGNIAIKQRTSREPTLGLMCEGKKPDCDIHTSQSSLVYLSTHP